MQRLHTLTRAITVAILLGAPPVFSVTIDVDTSTKYQTIDGFGAMLTLDPWKVRSGPFLTDVNIDSVGLYDTIISQLGATIIRALPDNYSWEATRGVYDLSAASRMRQEIKNMRGLWAAAERQQEPLRFFTTFLSPPGWMKVSGVAAGGVEAAPNYATTDCKLKDGYDTIWANHVVKYLQLMRDSTGVDFWGVSHQNEPAFQEPYASCVYSPARYASVARVVGEAIEAAGIPSKLIGAEHMLRAIGTFERPIRLDPAVRDHFVRWAGHGYTDGVKADTGSYEGETPTDKPLWMSETSGSVYGAVTDGINDWPKAMVLARSILRLLREARISAWVYQAIQTTCTSGDARNTYGLMADGTPTAKYYVSMHFYRYIRPGARQVVSTSDDSQVRVVAFQHAENDCYTIVALNEGTTAKTITALNGVGLPSEFEMVTSTETQKIVSTTVNASDPIELPASSVVTLVAGAYRHTGTTPVVSDQAPRPRAGVARMSDRVARVYSLDGHTVVSGSQRFVKRGVYVTMGRNGSVWRVVGGQRR
jgi:glucuronoarabinoxylan endo-1,4-beta-xylanase